MERHCGDCQLCCKLLPMQAGNERKWLQHPEMIALFGSPGMLPEFDKPAGERCPLQKHGKGCACYPRRPMGCRVWNCRWLVNNDTADLRRPDRSHYVIDLNPDFVRVEAGSESTPVEVIQIWVDPDYPNAHRDPALRRYLERQAEHGRLALIRFNERDGFVLIPPSMASDKQWHEEDSQKSPGPQGSTWPDDIKALLLTPEQEAL
jgi:hypothetical protein